MNLDPSLLLTTGAMEGPYRKTKPRVRRNRFAEAVRVLLAFLLTPNPWGSNGHQFAASDATEHGYEVDAAGTFKG